MSSLKRQKSVIKEEIKTEEDEYNIKIFRRTLENNTHEVIEDTKIKRVTSWRKSKQKFLQSLILNIFTLGIIHIISLFYPNLYIKLYCNRRKPKECDFFLVEDIFGKLTLCKKIYQKDKTKRNIQFSSDNSKEVIISSSLSNYNVKLKQYLTKNLTYSFKYRSVTYEYDENRNEITPVYMNLSNFSCKDIFHYFGEGLSSEGIVRIFQNRYGKNEFNLNFNMIYLYLLNVELPNAIFVIVIGIVELILSDYVSFIAKIIIIFILSLAEFINLKLTIFDSYKCDYTLDGEKNKIRAKRSYKFDENSEIFCKIDNCDLLPGDIILLKSNDIVPCDCILLEGECMVNSNNLLGNINIIRKISLENKNIPFSYQLNKDNILYHGMKIIKTYSNLKQGYISVLCVNTGPNTFKANLYSNIRYFFERKKEYNDAYSFIGTERKSNSFVSLAIILISVVSGLVYLFVFTKNKKDSLNFKERRTLKLFFKILVRVICKSVMPMYYLINSVIILLGTRNLKIENVHTFEKSKLLSSCHIDTLFISKTGTLCEDKFEINSFHPICINHHNLNTLGFRTYNTNQNKEINLLLVKYYKDYLENNNEYLNISYKKDSKNDNYKYNLELINKRNCQYSTLFLESLLSCNNLEKYGMEIFGNPIDSEIFRIMKWDIKADINYNNSNNSDVDYSYHKTDNDSEYSQINSYEKVRNDIFPNNYYKITESRKNEFSNQKRNSINLINYSYNKIEEENDDRRGSLSTNNMIKTDVSQCHIDSYKLRIYKRFIKEGALSSSSISFNFITKELRFNTKGIPEYILDKCNPNTIPDNFDRIISLYRRKGFIIIVCASKRINMEQYSDFDHEDKYMNDLTFFGFITLKNKLKHEVIYSLNELRLYNCNFIINTGDDIYNTLPVGFESTILDNKDIYSFEKDNIKNRIVINKIYNSKNSFYRNDDEEGIANQNQNNENINQDRYSRISKNFFKAFYKSSRLTNAKLKQSKVFDNSESNFKTYLKVDKKIEQFNLDGNNSNLIKENLNDSSTLKNKNNKTVYMNNLAVSSKDVLNSHDNPKNSINISTKQLKKNIQMSRKNMNSFDFNYLDSPRKFFINNTKTMNTSKNGLDEKNEVLYYYPQIFEDHKELNKDCIYCVSSEVFDFLFQNKNKRHAKMLLEKIHEKCRIYFNMTSLSKSKVVEYYREFNNNYICTVGECQSDVDSIITSNIGINLQPSRNINTILCHFYSPEANLLTIKKIIKEGRALKENTTLMKISCWIYTLIINSYILCCFIRQMDVIQGQLNFLEIAFLLLSICAFTTKADNYEIPNTLIQQRTLYICHYILQILGLIIIKALGIYFHASLFNTNIFIDEKTIDKIYTTFYFIFCIENLFSTVIVLNHISFFRKSQFFDTILIILTLLIMFYFSSIVTLTNSNYNLDIFGFLYFEFLENLVDAFDENNKITIFLICLIDFLLCIIYSRIVYYIFYNLSKKYSSINKK